MSGPRCPTCGGPRHPRPWARQDAQDGPQRPELDIDALSADGAQESPPRLIERDDPFYPTGTDW